MLRHLRRRHFFAELFPIASKYSSTAQLIRSRFGTLASSRRSKKAQSKNLDKALKILDLVIPTGVGAVKVEEESCHYRLVHGCLGDLLEVVRRSSSEKSRHSKSNSLAQHNRQKDLSNDVYTGTRKVSLVKEDAFMLFVELRKRGIGADAALLSSSISFVAASGDFGTGIQLHACSVKLGYDLSVLIGSPLISLYSKCGQLGNAHRVFQWLPERNIVSWTAIIAGYAQHWEVETCLRLFNMMRWTTLKPNDVTFASLLSACTGSASLLLGRSIHCLETRMGFNAYTHVSNALISMYAKCGSVDEASYIFRNMLSRDLISWNSMISAFSQYGLAGQAVDLLNEMDKQHIRPDAISYLCVLSSCRHAGHVEQGRQCFKMMHEHGVQPELGHYSCMVDLLSRAKLVEEALDFIEKMPIPPNAVIWGSLLSSCRVQGNIWIGIHAAEKKLMLQPSCPGTHVQLANLYASVGYWDHVARVRKLMKERGLKTSPGYSWIEVGNKIYSFKAEDTQVNNILSTLDCLACHMENLGYTSLAN